MTRIEHTYVNARKNKRSTGKQPLVYDWVSFFDVPRWIYRLVTLHIKWPTVDPLYSLWKNTHTFIINMFFCSFIISNSIKRGELAIKRPARWGSLSKTLNLLNDPNRAGRFIANFAWFLLFSHAVDVNPGMFRTNQTWFDVNGGTISKNEFNEVY